MRTHRLIFDCNDSKFADFFEDEILQINFCDFTHWYCGLDGAGEDTPDTCVIYRGQLNENRIYVEIDLRQYGRTVEQLEEDYKYYLDPYQFRNHNDWKLDGFKIEEIKYK